LPDSHDLDSLPPFQFIFSRMQWMHLVHNASACDGQSRRT
jgi:hypothetical protein